MPNANFPHFNSIDVQNFPQKLEGILNKNIQNIEDLLSKTNRYTWDNLMQPLEEMDNSIEQTWSPLSHLHGVMNSPELREAYQACLPKLSAYETAIGHNHLLYKAIQSLDKNSLNAVQGKIVEDSLKHFTLAGVGLSAEEKKRFDAIQARLAQLSNQFENNVLDATQAYQCHILDAQRLKGLPEHTLQYARALAQEKGLEGWLLTLEFPCYFAVVTYADDRALREELYTAYTTRASDQGPWAGKFDNTELMEEILSLRHEKAVLLGFANYAQLSLATKMAESSEEVLGFLDDLQQRAQLQARAEFNQLKDFTQENFQQDDLAPWDIAYFSEKKKQALYAISQEALRPYFPCPQVIAGLFFIIEKLYGISVEEIRSVDVWHPDVKCYQLTDMQGNIRGYIYADLFARKNKRSGAWMDSCQSRYKLKEGLTQLPIATLTCNFAPATENTVATLSHDEVVTLFHEFGHCLQHVLTQVNYLNVSGIHGVEWDAVELPSQFFENWCWQKEGLQLLSAHIKTTEPLPQALLDQLIAAKNFQSALALMRQLELSLFDFCIHQQYSSKADNYVASILEDVRKNTQIAPLAPFNRFQHSFTHIFGGGYAAGYYSYLWAEVLSSDAFERFEEEGIFNPKTGQDFLRCILEVGGSQKASTAYLAFRGRAPSIQGLLKQYGIQ